jgi:hypothetical protein
MPLCAPVLEHCGVVQQFCGHHRHGLVLCYAAFKLRSQRIVTSSSQRLPLLLPRCVALYYCLLLLLMQRKRCAERLKRSCVRKQCKGDAGPRQSI